MRVSRNPLRSQGRPVLGQLEIGVGTAPGGRALNHLSRLVGRAPAFAVLVSGKHFDGELATAMGQPRGPKNHSACLRLICPEF
jgi:hypothetical protein